MMISFIRQHFVIVSLIFIIMMLILIMREQKKMKKNVSYIITKIHENEVEDEIENEVENEAKLNEAELNENFIPERHLISIKDIICTNKLEKVDEVDEVDDEVNTNKKDELTLYQLKFGYTK